MTQKQINVDFTKIKSIPCECGCLLWDKRTVAKKISGIIIGSTQDTIAHIDVLVCSECKKISPDQENIVHLKIEL